MIHIGKEFDVLIWFQINYFGKYINLDSNLSSIFSLGKKSKKFLFQKINVWVQSNLVFYMLMYSVIHPDRQFDPVQVPRRYCLKQPGNYINHTKLGGNVISLLLRERKRNNEKQIREVESSYLKRELGKQDYCFSHSSFSML